MSQFLDIFEHISDASLWALDETNKLIEPDNYYCWSKKGQPKVIEHNGSHKGLNIIGATEVLNHLNSIYKAYQKGTDDDTPICATHIIDFLQRLLKYDAQRGIRKTFIILDNAGIHTAQSVKNFAKEKSDRLILIFQPPYSPQLNPQEEIWHWMKDFLAQSTIFTDIEDLYQHIKDFYDLINQNPNELKNRIHARKYYK